MSLTEPAIAARKAARLAHVERHVAFENEHDLDGVMGTFGPNPCYDDEPAGEHHQGRDGVLGYYSSLLAAMPDLHINIQRRHVSDDAVILEVRISGTHQGAWRGLPATGRRVSFPLCAVYTFTDADELAGERIFYDRATVLARLGVFRDPDSPAGQVLTVLNHPVTLARAILRRRRGTTPKR